MGQLATVFLLTLAGAAGDPNLPARLTFSDALNIALPKCTMLRGALAKRAMQSYIAAKLSRRR